MGSRESLNLFRDFLQAKPKSELHSQAQTLVMGDLILGTGEGQIEKPLLVVGTFLDCYVVLEGSTKTFYLASEVIGKDWKIFREGKELK